MNPEFWHNRWQEKHTGFHQSEVNPLLIKYWSKLNLPAGSRVFVPLCGKSIDMIWLAAQGYDIVGVELVESAVKEFFSENRILHTIINHPHNPNIKYYHWQHENQKIEILVADIFSLSIEDIDYIDAVYDRAALIALPADMRPDYSEQIRKVSDNAPQLLITLNYDQSKKDGPPFSINGEQLQQYYGNHYQLCELASESSSIGSAPDLNVTEHVWLLK
ncbi:thiopurine S-methyltransferase [Psychrobacter piscatorii]|uniref:thiopurine S-methyltransferase n=1 Tax=Psychrobacter piscatorii TaxID=554343 RepID=UPI001918504A|nr:thiopurine S-methyltransferase [Psychrobacter piscatorii]